MNPVLRRGFHGLLDAQVRLRKTPLRYLLVLGHMRCGSSLLLHLLGGHPDVRAYGESWITYRGRRELRDLVRFVHEGTRRLRVDETYVVDKILHDELLQAPELLALPCVTTLFMVREPERTLRSLHANRQRLLRISGWDGALEYYESRLDRLAALAGAAADGGGSALVRYERLVDDPARTLGALTRFLDLRSPLRDRYPLTRATGTAGLGDFSRHIREGRVVVTPPPEVDPVPEALLARARAAHERTVAELLAHVSNRLE